MYPILFEIGPLTIYSLGVFWALGALAAAWIMQLELKRYGYDSELAGTVVITAGYWRADWCSASVYHRGMGTFFSNAAVISLERLGFQLVRGLLVGGLTTAWSFKKYRLPFWEAADMSAPALALAYGMGRIGCFLAGDGTWGKVSDMPWAMAFPNAVAGWADPLTGVPYPPGVRVHPTQLYELVKSLIVFAILWSVRKRPHAPGMIFYLYLILAGSMRFIVEFWRVNPVVGVGLTEYHWMSLTLIFVGAGLLFTTKKQARIK
jgi:phosphatidylglycerol---prolipoprotein diacylglyceryl transferase